jgi:hypothetical protein
MVANDNKGAAIMPINSKKQSQAKQDWMAKNSKVYGVRVMKNSEPDLWEFLQGKEASTIFKLALREYIENHKGDIE